MLFCTEEGCIKSYQRLSSRQNHLDCGKHQYVLERETLYNKAMLKYAAQLEEGTSTNVLYVSDKAGNLERGEPSLKMGWALKVPSITSDYPKYSMITCLTFLTLVIKLVTRWILYLCRNPCERQDWHVANQFLK